jgi:hypothetical protein
VLAKAGPGIRFNEHLDYDDGAAVFQHACRWASRASCPSARTRYTVPADRQTGSN